MRLHTELARPELYAALTRCKDAGLIPWHVFISRDDEYPSQTHSRSFEVELYTQHGTVKPLEYGQFITEVSHLDPSAVIQQRLEA